jgi:phospholipid/cholesterol/gamma-HCH transport system substrate-binding protein
MMKKELKIGIFAVTVIVASFFVLNYLRGEDIFNRESEYISTYSNLEGLVASAPVYIKGYKAGKVSEVAYDKERGCFEVVCSVSKDFAVPSDSKMTIYSVDIMGGKGVRIDLGVSEELAQDGDTLEPAFETGLMDGLSSMITPLMSKVEKTIDSLGVTITGVNRLLSESNTNKIEKTLIHVESIMADLKSVSAKVNGKSDDITDLIGNLKVFSDSLGCLMAEVEKTVEGAGEAVASINAADLTGTVNSVKTLVDNLNDPDGTIGKLFVDNSIYDSVDSLLINIDRFIDKIQENPKKYLRISVF